MTASRCQVCDRDNCPTRAAPPHVDAARTAHDDCAAHAIDWRALALAAESERNALRLSTLTAAEDARRVCEEREQAALRMWRAATAQLDAVRAHALAAESLAADTERQLSRSDALIDTIAGIVGAVEVGDGRRRADAIRRIELLRARHDAAVKQLAAVRAIVERLAEHDEAMTRGPWFLDPTDDDILAPDDAVKHPDGTTGNVVGYLYVEQDFNGACALRNALPELIAAVGVRS